ncbi:hypothetical protein EDD15DRAFT_2375147 [Pisolithus albus]|nr:hypothetical protein EDD15DRAFT_2375147 [Pisolithus albus]
MPRAAKTTNSSGDPTDLHTRVLRNRKIPTPQQVPTPHDTAPTCPPSEGRRVKPQRAVEPPEGWEEHMFGYRDRRRSLTPRKSLTSTPSPRPPKENPIPEEDAEMGTPERSSDEVEDEVEGDEGRVGDSGSDDREGGGDDDNSSLPPSSPLPFEPSNSSDDKDELPSVHQSTRTSGKGKGKATDVADADVADSDCDTPPRKSKKPGVMSRAALDDIRDFASKVKKEAEELGRRHGRSTRDILVAAGFGVKPSHTKLNEANLFRSWYWATQPKPEGAKRDEINDIITKEYKSLIQDIPKDDTAARREKLKHVYEWSENSSAVPTSKSVKSIAARVQNAKTQFSGLAEAWSNLEEIDLRSPAWSCSDMVRNFINQHAVDVRAQMDKYTSVFKYLRDGGNPGAGLPGTSAARGSESSLELRCRPREIPRDRNRRVFGSMIKEKLLAALKDLRVTRGIEVGDPQKIVWQRLLEFMTKNYLIILNWPHGVSPPGPGFEYKKLKGDPLRKLVVPYLCRKLGVMYDGRSDDDEEQDSLDGVPEIDIRPWNQDVIKMSESPHLKGEIPLVKAADGMVLRKVSDDPSWQKKAREGDDSRHEEGVDPLQQRQLPFPSRKRPRAEASNDDTMDQGMSLRNVRPIQGGHGDESRHRQGNSRRQEEDFTHQIRHSTLWYGDLRRGAPNRENTREHGSSQPLPRRYEDLRHEHADYNEAGPSNEPYNAMPPRRNVRPHFPPPVNSITACRLVLTLMFTMMPTPQNWGNRGNMTQYEDEILDDYVEEDY